MDSFAVTFFKGLANQGKPLKVFDWDKAAQILRDEHLVYASACLQGDCGPTGGTIFSEGKPVPRSKTYTYLASNWATPIIEFDNGDTVECFVMEDEAKRRWGDVELSHVYWPDSALAILGIPMPADEDDDSDD